MRRIRLVLLTGSLNIGGTERNILHLASALDMRRYHVEVWCVYRGHPLEREIGKLGIPCRTFKGPSLGRRALTRAILSNLPFQWRLWRALLRHRPHVLHVFGFPAAYYGVLLGRLAGARRVIFAVQDWDVWKRRSRIYRWLDAACCRLAAAVVADGRGARDLSVRRQGMQPKKLRVIYDGVRTSELISRRSRADVLTGLRLDPARPVAAVVARLDARKKGQDVFIRSIPRVSALAPGTQFLLVGGGPDERVLRNMAEQLPPGRRPTFAGFRTDLADLLHAIDILVIPSRWESVPKIMLEAMWCGVPVVATKVGDIEEILDQTCGMLVPADSPAALAEAIVELSNDPSKRSELAANARRRIESRGLVLQKSIEHYDRMYREMAGRSAPIVERSEESP